jgi:hypothetical protein
MNTILILKWSLASQNQEDTFKKYCPNCGKKVLFIDSRMRRRNANGKDIHEYAIYKCPKGHTWNKSIRRYKAYREFIRPSKEFVSETELPFQTLMLSECSEKGVEKIEIYLNSVNKRRRIDRFLAERVKDLSRTRIRELIEAGFITINGQKTKPGELLKPGQKITLVLQFFH